MFNRGYSCFFFILFASSVLAEIPQEDKAIKMHQEALAFARNGETALALEQLAYLHASFPEHTQYHYDYIAVLGWAENDEDVLAHAEQLTLDELPPYILETIGKSARNIKRYGFAIQAYQTALQHTPSRLQSRLGLALALSEHNKSDEALAVLANHVVDRPSDRLALLEGEAYAYVSSKQYFAALTSYEKILQLDPSHQNGQRGRILMAHRLGAPHLASSMMKMQPGLLTENEMAAINSDVAAISIRWGYLPAHSSDAAIAQRQQTNAAITDLEKRLVELNTAGKGESIQFHRVAFDLMIALQVVQRSPEVVAYYQLLKAQSARFPKHALIAAADAYFMLEEPQIARDLYQQVLSSGKKDLPVQLSLFYAYIECEEYDSAVELIDHINQQQPRWKRLAGSPTAIQNPDKVSIEITAAFARAYIDQLAEAQTRLELIHKRAPANLDIRSSLAYIYLWRGWPRRALEEFKITGLHDESHLDAAIGRVHARYALYEFPVVEQNIAALNLRHPMHARLKQVNRLWELHNMRELRVELSRGISSGSQLGSQNLTLNSHLYGAPMHYHLRPYLHHLHTQARFPTGTSYYRRVGAGIEYRGHGIELRSELSRNLGGSAEIGLNSSGMWMLDDHWSFTANIDSNSNDVPLRGRDQGVDGWGSGIGVSYRFHELRRIDASLQWLEFSDSNRRQSASVSLDQRLINKVDYKLNGIASLNVSQNTRINAPYFNPLSDLTLQLGVVNEWLLVRHYDYAYRHRLGIMVGQYQQKDYRNHPIWTIRYEHQWNFNDRTELRYAISRGQRAYDGETELNIQFDLTLIWRF
ncbi:hypothetical protein MNBD_GAMMA17-1306 [hydrothermal vent metagenome]|uniref:PgaA membrane beta barrel domain-containing protein n=1 Tax=hydrothermal vent metagenome TaxID=652676 RepID=A0A3B0ZXB1_9ZZZZ